MATPHGMNFLMVPGPSYVPERVLQAMHRQSVDHRSTDFPKLVKACLEDLKKVFLTEKGTPIIFMATGTGGWESALANTLCPGDKVLTCRYGQFSHLWIDMMERFGLKPIVIECEWGTGAPKDEIEKILKEDTAHEIKAVCIVQNETTTGVYSDIPGISKVIKSLNHPALYMVDGVSSIASLEFRFDEWEIDVAITGSQKGLMLPAGMGFVCASPRAIEISKTISSLPRVFFSWKDMMTNNELGYFPYTPSSQMLYGLREAIAMLMEEGLENVWARHNRLAEGVRRAVAAWGLTPCCKNPSEYSGTVTTIMLPQGYDGVEVMKHAYQKYNMSLGGGLMKLKGKAFRIGTLGHVNELIMLGCLAGTEIALRDVGYPVTFGSGVAAAQEYWSKTALPSRGLGDSTQSKI